MFRLFECCALSFFERFVLSLFLKIERFVSDSAEIWICGLYYSIARAYDSNKDYENAIHFYEKFMSLTPKNQRFPYDEEGKIIESATTMYQIAEKRVKKIREEDFFRNGAPDDFFVVPKKIDIKKDTVASKQ